MKRITLFAVLAVSLGLAACKSKEAAPEITSSQEETKSPVSTKKADPEKFETLPGEVPVIDGYIVQSIDPVFFESCRINPFESRNEEIAYIESSGLGIINSYPDFYPLGWSKDGKLAFCIKQFYDGRGETQIRFIIQDTITDKIIYQLDDWNCSTISVFVSNYSQDIDEKIYENKINLIKQDLISAKEKTDISYKVQALNITDSEYGFKQLDYMIQAKKGSKSKTLMTKKEVLANSVFVCGSLKSPFEDRLAVIIAEVDYGFEGCDIQYHITGCHTTVGF